MSDNNKEKKNKGRSEAVGIDNIYSEISADLLEQLHSDQLIGVFKYNYISNTLICSNTLNILFAGCADSKIITKESLIDCITTDDQNWMKELFEQPKVSSKKVNGRIKIIQKTKEYRESKVLQISGRYITEGETTTGLIAVVRDISKEVKRVKEIQRNLERSEESDRIKTNFLLNISHNIRTPMNSILGFSELLNMTDPDPERRKEYIQVIKKQSKSLLELIDDVAEIAKYESGNLTITKSPVNINLLINDVVREIQANRSEARKEKVGITLELPSKTGVEIYTDSGRLHQVFVNLIAYSLKHTIEGGIRIGYTLEAGDRIDFFIKDSSPGLSKEALKTLFEPFGLSKGEQNRYDDDTGLGLSIAKSILKLLGGKISVESEPEEGNSFKFSLPYESIPSNTTKSIDDELLSDQYKWNDKVILIVEDEDVNGLFLEAIFQETGAQTLYAKNGHQAIELCKSINKIDLILMDIKMPVMNGLRATQEIRKFNQSIPIIAQTALSLEEDRQNCLLAGCNDLVTKPIEVEELLYLVNQYLPH